MSSGREWAESYSYARNLIDSMLMQYHWLIGFNGALNMTVSR